MRHVLVCLLLAACATPPPITAAANLMSSEDVAEDVATLRRGLEEAYAGRAFATDDSWRSLQRRLDELSRRAPPVEAICDALGDALSRASPPGLFVLDATGARCGSRGTFEANDGGPNVAADAEAAYALVEEAGVAILGVRHFGPEGWDGIDAAIARALSADAILVDLREARGEDPRPALPLLTALSGLDTLAPLQAIRVREGALVDELRAAAPAGPRRDPDAFRPFVGTERPCRTPPRTDVPGHIRDVYNRPLEAPFLAVLLGGECGGACELVARSLQVYAGADLRGGVGSEERLALADPGLLVLPRSGLRIFIPTAAYLLNPRVQRSGGLAGGWQSAQGRGERRPLLAAAMDEMGRRVAQREALLPWVEEDPPACATYTAYATREAMPSPARERTHGWDPDPSRTIRAFVYLPPERA
ncbi:MAG: hypothetical protein ACFCGT_20635 [Sandaracinaceae bacterium]